MAANFKDLELGDAQLIETEVHKDKRGFLLETYNRQEFQDTGIKEDFVLQLHSHSKKRVIRGLHFQRAPFQQSKLVYCQKGKIFDVIVDLRKNSPTFGEHLSITLSETDKNLLYVPKGFAHGFAALTDNVDVFYQLSNEYSPEHAGGVKWDDPQIGVDWPIEDPIVSAKDQKLPSLDELTPLKRS